MTARTPPVRTSRMLMAAAAVLVVAGLLAVVEAGGPSALLEPLLTRLTLISGPLVEGPLVDLGGLLNGVQLGQFQQ